MIPAAEVAPVADVAGPGLDTVPAGPAPAPVPAGPPATLPPPVPAPAPVQTAPAPLPTDPAAVARQGLADTNAATNESVQAAKTKADLDAQQAQAKADFDRQNAEALAKFQADQVKHRADADAEIASKRAAFENAPFRSLWSTRTAGQKAEIALGLLAGGISWNSNHTNRAIDILNQAEQEDLARQKEQHADLWRDLQLSLDNRKELDSRQLHELSDWQSLQAAKWNAIAGKLNTLIAANKGRADVADAEKARVEALDKANQAWTNAVNAKATARHLDAQTKLTQEETLNQPGIRAKNAAETQKLLAEASNGGLSKFEQTLIGKLPTMFQRDQDVKNLYGSPGQPGPLLALPKIEEAQQEIKNAIANRDDAKLAQVIVSSREQLSKLLAGTVLTEANKKLQDSLQGSPEEAASKVKKLLGNPSVGANFAHNIYGLLDDARESQLREIDSTRKRLYDRHLGPSNPIAKSPALRDALKQQIDSYFNDVRSGGGAVRYQDGTGAGTVPTHAADLVTIHNNKTGETKQVTRDEAKRLGAL
jgi:hypothetical protein